MQERERTQRPANEPGGSEGGGDDPMADLRTAADRLLENADRALERAISADSVAFLQANQQTVGQ